MWWNEGDQDFFSVGHFVNIMYLTPPPTLPTLWWCVCLWFSPWQFLPGSTAGLWENTAPPYEMKCALKIDPTGLPLQNWTRGMLLRTLIESSAWLIYEIRCCTGTSPVILPPWPRSFLQATETFLMHTRYNSERKHEVVPIKPVWRHKHWFMAKKWSCGVKWSCGLLPRHLWLKMAENGWSEPLVPENGCEKDK